MTGNINRIFLVSFCKIIGLIALLFLIIISTAVISTVEVFCITHSEIAAEIMSVIFLMFVIYSFYHLFIQRH